MRLPHQGVLLAVVAGALLEPVAVSGQELPVVEIEVVEAVTVSDEVTVIPPAVIEIVEVVAVSDSVAAIAPVVVEVAEAVVVSDSLLVIPPVEIEVVEAVTTLDAYTMVPPLTIEILESISVYDSLAITVSTHTWGDPDLDYTISAFDALICLRAAVNLDVSAFDIVACDVAPDGGAFVGRVSAFDALAILSFVVGKSLPETFRVGASR